MDQLKRAIRLNPFPPYWYCFQLGSAYLLKHQYEDAVTAFKKAIQVAPDNYSFYSGLALTYSLLGREEEARVAGKKVLELNPGFSGDRSLKSVGLKDQAYVQLLLETMHKAGLNRTLEVVQTVQLLNTKGRDHEETATSRQR